MADDLGPTVRDLGDLSPDLQHVLLDFTRGGLIRSADRTLPDAERFLRGARPVFGGLHTFLPELNPVLSFANFYRGGLADFIAGGGPATLNGAVPSAPGDPTPAHFLPQTGLLGANSDHFGFTEQREVARGNSYIGPNTLLQQLTEGIIPSFSCQNNPGEQEDPVGGAGSEAAVRRAGRLRHGLQLAGRRPVPADPRAPAAADRRRPGARPAGVPAARAGAGSGIAVVLTRRDACPSRVVGSTAGERQG